MALIKKAMQYGPIRSGYAPAGWQSEGDLGGFTAPADLAEGGGSYAGGAVSGGSVAGGGAGVSDGSPAATKALASFAPSMAQVPISSLLALQSLTPAAYDQYQLGAAPEEEGSGATGTIARILARKRL
jgi:hypothetical protein